MGGNEGFWIKRRSQMRSPSDGWKGEMCIDRYTRLALIWEAEVSCKTTSSSLETATKEETAPSVRFIAALACSSAYECSNRNVELHSICSHWFDWIRSNEYQTIFLLLFSVCQCFCFHISSFACVDLFCVLGSNTSSALAARISSIVVCLLFDRLI